jgi:hypothetical protein
MTEPARRQGGVMIDCTVVANDPSAPSSSMRFKAIFGGAFGNFIEWYDFAIYGFLAAILAGQISKFRSKCVTTREFRCVRNRLSGAPDWRLCSFTFGGSLRSSTVTSGDYRISRHSQRHDWAVPDLQPDWNLGPGPGYCVALRPRGCGGRRVSNRGELH